MYIRGRSTASALRAKIISTPSALSDVRCFYISYRSPPAGLIVSLDPLSVNVLPFRMLSEEETLVAVGSSHFRVLGLGEVASRIALLLQLLRELKTRKRIVSLDSYTRFSPRVFIAGESYPFP